MLVACRTGKPAGLANWSFGGSESASFLAITLQQVVDRDNEGTTAVTYLAYAILLSVEERFLG